MTNKQVSVQLTDATIRQIEHLKTIGYGNRTDIIRLAIDRMFQKEFEESKPVMIPEDEYKASTARLGYLDRLSPKCAWDKHDCQLSDTERRARRRYNHFLEAQQRYEEKYL